jgi:hypothetical protein
LGDQFVFFQMIASVTSPALRPGMLDSSERDFVIGRMLLPHEPWSEKAAIEKDVVAAAHDQEHLHPDVNLRVPILAIH